MGLPERILVTRDWRGETAPENSVHMTKTSNWEEHEPRESHAEIVSRDPRYVK